MQAVVLVGGFGTRLRPLTLDTPKQMLTVCGVTMFERVIDALGKSGITEAIVSLGFKPQAFTDAFPSGECAGVKLNYAIEPEPLDTAGAIRFAALAAGVTETFLVVNGDVLTDLRYSDLIEKHRQFAGEATIHLTPVEDPSRFGVVPTDETGKVLAFVEKPDPGTEPTNQINAGTYVMEPSVLDRIPEGRSSVERDIFPALAADGKLFATSTSDYWLDAGTPSAFLQANLDLAFGERTTGAQAVDGSATLSPTATVERSVIGADAAIGDGAEVRGSLVMAGATICPGARVVDSIVAAGATVGDNAHISEYSVVGFAATVAAGIELRAGTEPEKSTWQV